MQPLKLMLTPFFTMFLNGLYFVRHLELLAESKFIFRNKYHLLLVQFCRYVMVGGIAFVADFAVFNGVLTLQGHYILAAVVGFLVGLVVNYSLCIYWVWRGTQARAGKDLAIFTLIGVIGLLLTTVLIMILVDFFSFDARISKIVVAIIVLFWNFNLRKVFVFFK
jgi:putative flippase GtrA